MSAIVPERLEVREVIARSGVAMLMTLDGENRIVGRPMLPLLVDGDPYVYFLTHKSSARMAEIRNRPRVSVTITGSDSRYLVIAGTATASDDEATIARLWKPTCRAWFPGGADDREALVLRVDVERVDYWKAPRSRISRVVQAAWALVTRRPMETAKSTLPGL
jgi:general stress protein 26